MLCVKKTCGSESGGSDLPALCVKVHSSDSAIWVRVTNAAWFPP